MKLDDDLATWDAAYLLNIWFAIMSGEEFREYRDADRETREAFYLRLCRELNLRMPKRG